MRHEPGSSSRRQILMSRCLGAACLLGLIAQAAIAQASCPPSAIDASTAEFVIRLDGTVTRRSDGVKDTVAIFADAPARHLFPGHDEVNVVNVEVFAIDSSTPATDPRLKAVQTLSCSADEFVAKAIQLDRSKLHNADVWRLVIMLPRAVADSLDLGQPQARDGIRWDRLKKHADEYEAAFVRWKIAESVQKHSGTRSEVRAR